VVGDPRGRDDSLFSREGSFLEIQQLAKIGRWDFFHPENRLHWSETIFEIFGLDPREFQPSYEAFLAAIFPADREKVHLAWEKSLKERTPYEIQHRVQVPDGGLKWVVEICRTEFSFEGAPVHSVGFVQDITRQKEAERELYIKQWAIASSNNAVALADLTQHLTYVNPIFLQWWGYTDEKQVLGRSTAEFWEAKESAEEVIRLVQQQGSWRGELRAKRNDGTLFELEVATSVVRDECGNPLCVFGSFVDITQRKRSERSLTESNERLRVALDSMDALVYIADMQTYDLLFVNEAIKEKWGRNLVGEKCWKVIQQGMEGPCPFCTNSKLVTPDGKATGVYQWEFQNLANGRWYECRDRAIPWVDGRLVRLEIATDIHERKLMEQELRKAKEAAESATAAKSRFLSTMSHELRTPLNSIIGFCEQLSRTSLDEQQKHDLEYISFASKFLENVVGDILDFSKIEAGKMRLHKVPTALRPLCERVVQVMQCAAEQKGNSLRLEYDPDIPRLLELDEMRVEQVLLNLVGNAVKFTQQGWISLRVSLMRKDRARKQATLTFEVVDEGIGISEEQAKTIFDSFEQGDSSTTRKYGGTGLGLAIVSGLLNLMDSSLSLESTPGKGSRFWFTLSVPWSGKSLRDKGDDGFEDLKGFLVPGDSACILLAEDDTFSRILAKKILGNLVPGVQILEAGNGEEALELFRNNSVNLVFMDISMPFMDGLQATGEIRMREKASEKRVPIIAWTAYADQQTRERCLEAGMDDFLVKPQTMEGVARVLREWLVRK